MVDPSSPDPVIDWRTGFGYQFNTLRDHSSGETANELANAFEKLLTEATVADVVGILGYKYPFVQKLVGVFVIRDYAN